MAAAVSDIDDLFQLPLDEFTAARNALAAQLKKAGRGDEADKVKGLPKPPVSAWAVNQLYWQHRQAFDRLLAAGERFRKGQAAQLAGKSGDLREPLEARREALSALTKLASNVLQQAGHNPSPDTMRRVMTTLEALATYGPNPEAPPAGRLTDDVDPPGFEAIAALIPRSGRGESSASGPTRVIPFRQKRESRGPKKTKQTPEELKKQQEEERKTQLAAAKAALQEAERTLRAARRAAKQAEAALKKAAARAKEAEKAKAEIETQVEKASAEADETRQEARRVASEAENAAQEVEDAERSLEKARRELEALS
jgi:hypothetical protein